MVDYIKKSMHIKKSVSNWLIFGKIFTTLVNHITKASFTSGISVMAFNATFNNLSVLLVE